MTLVGLVLLILVLALIGFLVWIITTYIPMPDIFQKVIMVVIAVVVILYIIGLITGSATLPELRTIR